MTHRFTNENSWSLNNQREYISNKSVSDLEFAKVMCGTKETLFGRRQREIIQAVPGWRKRENDKTSACGT